MSERRLPIAATAVALLLLLGSFAASSAHAASVRPSSSLGLAVYDLNSSKILPSTSKSGATAFGRRSRFHSPFDADPTVFVSHATFYTPAETRGITFNDYMVVPYCIDAAGKNSACSFDGYVLYMLFRFRGGQEVNFRTEVWQRWGNDWEDTRALEKFETLLNRTDVKLPHAWTSSRIEEGATCSDFTDECWLSRSATYTASYKEIDPSEYSGRFVFRIGSRYSLDSTLRMRLTHTLPHDSLSTVDVVFVLSRVPVFNPLNPRWWLETAGGCYAMLVGGLLIAFGFLIFTREIAGVLARRHNGDPRTPPAVVLYEEGEMVSVFDSLRRVMAVTAGGVQRSVQCAATPLRELKWRLPCASWWPLCRNRRRRLPTSEEASVEAEQEIAAVDTAGATAQSDDDEAGPMCRICRSREPFDDLFAPCACNGSSKYVHHHCLEQWRAMTTNAEHRRVCAECKTPYTLVRVVVPVSADQLTSSPVIEPAIRHFSSVMAYFVAATLFIAVCAYGLKAMFFVVTGLDWGVDWTFANGYHWVLVAYLLIALPVNLELMQLYLSDVQSPELQLCFVLLSLIMIEIPLSYSMSAFLCLFFDRLISWEVSYGLGLLCTSLLHAMDAFSSLCEVLRSYAVEREVVAARAEPENAERPAEPLAARRADVNTMEEPDQATPQGANPRPINQQPEVPAVPPA